MSEDRQATDILLPSASVAVYSHDPDTLKAAAQIRHDWRFSRVSLDIIEADVHDAISNYANYASPELLIIQTDQIDEQFTHQLEELAGHCSEGTAAIVIGPVNDVYLYRSLIKMGVSDYLVKPLRYEVLSEVIAKSLVNKLGVSESRLVVFMGTKGGVGTSTLCQLMALGVSEVLGQKTVLIDAAGGWSSLSVGMGFDPSSTLREVVRAVEKKDEDSLKRMFFEFGERLSVLSGGGDPMLDPTISPDQYERFLDMLMVKSPVVFADLSGAETPLRKMLLSRANQIILVTTPTLTSLRFARSLIKEIGDLRGGSKDDVSLVVNKLGLSKNYEMPIHDIEKAIDIAPSAVVANAASLFLGNETNIKKILTDREGSEIIKSALLPILRKTISIDSDGIGSGEGKKSGLLGGFLTKLTSK